MTDYWICDIFLCTNCHTKRKQGAVLYVPYQTLVKMMQRPESGQEHHLPSGQQPRKASSELTGDVKPEQPNMTMRKMILSQLNEWQIDTEIQSAMLANRKNAMHKRS